MVRQCASCKLESPLEEAFHSTRKGGHRKFYCPRCWGKHRQTKDRNAWLFVLGMAGIGLANILLLPGAAFGWLLLNGVLALGLLPLLILPHELGHAMVARLLGLRVFGIYVGIGRTLWKGRLRGVHLEVKAIPAGGITQFAPAGLHLIRSKYFLTVLAGPAVNAALLVGILLFIPLAQLYPLDRPPGPYSDPVTDLMPDRLLLAADLVLANLVLLALNLWPRKIRVGDFVLDNDGLALVKAPFLSAAEIRRIHAQYFALQGQSCYEEKRYAAAAEWFRQGLTQYADDLHNLFGLGGALLNLGDFEAAMRPWRGLLLRADLGAGIRLILLNNIAVADLLLAGSAGRSGPGRPACPERADLLCEADCYSTEAFKSCPWVPEFKGTCGCVLVELGEGEKGSTFLREVMQEHKAAEDRAFCACYLALGEARQGRVEQGRRFLETARKLDPECVALRVVAGELETAPLSANEAENQRR